MSFGPGDEIDVSACPGCGTPHTVTLDPDLTSWTALGMVTFVAVTGRGGGGGGAESFGTAGGGGGGGGYASKTLPGVGVGDVVSYQTGTAGNSGSSWFKTTGTVLAGAGDDGVGGTNSGGGGTGGAGGVGVAGDVLHDGCPGGDYDGFKAGDGGSAGAAGGDCAGAAGGAGGTGDGGNGTAPGGGGGGAWFLSFNGDGTDGTVVVTYFTCP